MSTDELENNERDEHSLGSNSDHANIRLDHSRNSQAFNQWESLWGKEIHRVLRLLQTHQNTLKNKHEDLPLLSIALFGTYGSGKSSFLRTLVKFINGEEDPKKCKSKEKPRKDYPNLNDYGELKGSFALDVFEPNRLAKDDNFLYAFLAQTLEADQKKHKREDDGAPIISKVQSVFKGLCKHLQVLDETLPPEVQDPLEISLARLDRHTSDIKLRNKLEKYIDELVKSLTADDESLILMPVDDSDTSLDSLTDTLEMLRLYLRHPRLIPIFAFTGRLAEELLRVHFENQLIAKNKSLEKRDKLLEASTDFSMSENLAQQYLGKLFPVRNRIKLGIASARVQIAELDEFKVIKKKNEREKKEKIIK